MSSLIAAPGRVRSSMNTFVIKLLMTDGLIAEYCLDHSTTPEVVRISKESNIIAGKVYIGEKGGVSNIFLLYAACVQQPTYDGGRRWQNSALIGISSPGSSHDPNSPDTHQLQETAPKCHTGDREQAHLHSLNFSKPQAMQRPTYGAPPPNSPPLHHPVPQHVSTVPQLRSPPPPLPQQQGGAYGNPYQPSPLGAAAPVQNFGAYGNFMTDPTAQMGFQVGQTALRHGQEIVEQNINKYVNVGALKHYFNVTNSYVVNKLFLVLFPWRHKPWSRKQTVGPNGQEGWFKPPREDLNSPDMYIPGKAAYSKVKELG